MICVTVLRRKTVVCPLILLREEGSSFQELKDHLRRDLAIYHLGRDELAIQDIAEQLGFSKPSAFHRAFKKWTGLTPGAYRAQEE